MKISFVTLGCKVNLSETQGLMQLAAERGHTIVERDAQAVIVNSCAVTAVSEHKNLRALHKARKEHPEAVIAVIGCFAQTNADKLRQDGTAQLIFGVQDRAEVLDACEKAVMDPARYARAAVTKPIGSVFEVLPAGIPQGRTRALLKVEDGCNNFCSYCIIPYARGRVRSLDPEIAVQEAQRLTAEGVHEIVVTGIEISSYGMDLSSGFDLTGLMELLCAACPETRFRLGSLEPRTITAGFCERLAGFDNLAKHFHLSLQSGCDSVLSRMNRKYTVEMFRCAAAMLRRYFPSCSITTDIIVGFPGETEEEFAETCDFVKELLFSDVHVFPYSVRPGTRAAGMQGQIAESVKKERADKLRAAAESGARQYRERFIGEVLPVVPEHRNKDGYWAAHSRYSFPVYVDDDTLRKNQPVNVRIKCILNDGLLAETDFSADKIPF